MHRRSFLLGLLALTGCGSDALTVVPPSPTAAPTRTMPTPQLTPTPVPPTPTRTYLSGADVGCTGPFAGVPVFKPSAVPPLATRTALTTRRMMEFDHAQQRWMAANISSYRLKVDSCGLAYCGGPRIVEVMNGTVVNKQPTGANIVYMTVPDLFAIARREIDDTCRAISSLTYDPIYGYPTTIYSDIIVAVTDSSISYKAFDFVPAP